MSAVPKGASLEATRLMVSDIRSPCPAAMSMPELSAHIVRPGRLCLLEMDVSVIIRVILKLETALESSVSFKGGIPPVCIDYRHFQLDKTFPQSPTDCGGLTRSFLEVHRRRGGLRRPTKSRRFRRRHNSVLPDLDVSPFFCFSLLPHFHLWPRAVVFP